MNENITPSSIPEGLSSIADDEAITEIDLTDFLEKSSKESPLFEGFHEDIERTEKSLENELQSLYDDIMGSGPETIVPKPMSMLTESEAEPKKVALSDPQLPEDDNSSLDDLWMNPDDYFDDDIPVVSLDDDNDGEEIGGQIPDEAFFAPAAAPAEEAADEEKDNIFSMIDILKAETDSETGFDDILSEIESNEAIVPVDTELSAAVQLVSAAEEEPEEEEELVFGDDFDWDDLEIEEPAAMAELPEPSEIPAVIPEDTADEESEASAEDDFDRELAALLGDEPDDVFVEAPVQDELEASAFVINVPDDDNDYESAAASPEKLYVAAPMSSAKLEDDPDLLSDDYDDGEDDGKKGKKKKDKQPKEPAKGGVGEVIRKIVLTISIITIIVSCGILVNTYFIEPYRFRKDADDLASQMSEGIDTHSDSGVVDAQLQSENPDVEFPEGMLAKYAQLYAANDDLAGWISIPGFGINLPIAQGSDNNYYLKKDIYGKYTRYGVPFFDYRMTDLVNLHRNTVVYGHNMRHDDLIFGMLENYREIKGGFDTAPVIECNTIYGDHTWFVYAVFITNAEESDDNGYVFPYNFIDVGNAKFEDYIEEIDKRKLYTTGVDISSSDKILTLSTCSYDFDDARLVVVARERREGESINVDTSKAYKNDNPKYPQAWYDTYNKTNPYSGDTRW